MDFKNNNARVVFFYAKMTQLHIIPKPISCRREISMHSSSQSYHLMQGQYKYISQHSYNEYSGSISAATLAEYPQTKPFRTTQTSEHMEICVVVSHCVNTVKILQPCLSCSDPSTFLSAQQKLSMIRVLTSDN